MPATNVDADVQPQTLYQLVQRPKTGYQIAYGEFMADPVNKALIKTLPPIELADGSTTRRGVDKRHFAEIWKNMDPDRKAVYQAAGAEALEALHVRIGAPSKRARGSDDDEDEDGGEGGEGGSASGSRKKARRAGGGGGRKATTNLAKVDITGALIAGQFLHNKRWHIELANGVVIKVGKVFGSVNKAMGIKKAGAAKRGANPFILWKSAKAVATKAAQEHGTELPEEFAVAKYSELPQELKAKYVQMAADLKAAAAAAPVSTSGSGSDDAMADASEEDEEEADEEEDEEADEEDEEEEADEE